MNTLKKIAFCITAAVALLTASCKEDELNVAVTNVVVEPMSLRMVIGDEEALTAIVEPESATNKDVVWTSSNKEVATVSEDGKVTALEQGEAKISVTTVDGGFRTSCIVTVFKARVYATGVTLNADSITLEQGRQFRLIAAVQPEDVTDTYVSWRSDSSLIARVTPSGNVQAIGVGTTKVFVTTRDGGFRDTCIVTVAPKVIRVEEVMLSHSTLTLTPLAPVAQLTATVNPELAQNRQIDWVSSNPAVATVTSTGEFTAQVTNVGTGTATITVTARDTAISASCEVTVGGMELVPTVNLSMGAHLRAAMENVNNVGKKLVLPEGYQFQIDTTITPAGSMIVEGSGATQANIICAVTGAFNIPTTAGTVLEFVNLNIYRDNAGNSDSHVINTNANCLATRIAFTSCRLADFGRNFMRARNSTVYDNLYFDSCVFENMGVTGGNYGFIHLENDAVVRNIVIKNSTFNKNGCHFIHANTATTRIETIDIQNCTFYQMVGSSNSRWFINVNTGSPGATITMKNVILGSTERANNGINRAGNPTETYVNVYQTTDWNLSTGTIDEATQYNGTATDLFVDPANGDFHILDAAFAGNGTAGDPRWY